MLAAPEFMEMADGLCRSICGTLSEEALNQVCKTLAGSLIGRYYVFTAGV